MKEVTTILDSIIECEEGMITCRKALMESIKDLKEALGSQYTETPKTEQKTYTFTDVRGILASLSGQGKRSEARKLLHKFGVEKLSDLKPEDYPTLMQEAEVIANA